MPATATYLPPEETVLRVLEERRTQLSRRKAVLWLPADPASVRGCRHRVMGVLQAWKAPAVLQEDAVLVIGELAANAAEHGRTDMTVLLELTDEQLQLMVTDYGVRKAPPACTAQEGGDRGRGMTIVEALSTWHVTSCDTGHYAVRAALELGPARRTRPSGW